MVIEAVCFCIVLFILLQASGRKKVIPVIPAMPSRRPGRGGTRMQDAGAALSRNKLLKIVSVVMFCFIFRKLVTMTVYEVKETAV
jgi:hypothetical protein